MSIFPFSSLATEVFHTNVTALCASIYEINYFNATTNDGTKYEWM